MLHTTLLSIFPQSVFEGPMLQYLLLGRGPELPRLAGGLCGRHGKGQHELVVALSLVGLYLADKLVRERYDGLHSVSQLAVTEVLQQGAHLGYRKTSYYVSHYGKPTLYIYMESLDSRISFSLILTRISLRNGYPYFCLAVMS